MYKEDKRTAEQISKDVLNRLKDIDTRESSVSYQIATATSYEIRNLILQANYNLRQNFIATAEGGYLDLLAKQFKFTREEPETATVKAEIIGNDVPIGSRFASVGLQDSIIYRTIEHIEGNFYYLKAEELHDKASYYVGDIIIIDFIPNLTSAKITEITYPQRQAETDEEFRKRINENLIAEATDGNKAQYKKWLSEFKGVGKSKITSLWNGPNTVKCTILNDVNKSASSELLQKVQAYLDPNSEGLGEGKAPIGAIVTVDTATDFPINIDLEVVYKGNRETAPTLEKELNDFFSDIAFERSVVSYLQIAGVISNNIDIDYITSLQINGAENNVSINDNQVPVLGTLNINRGAGR